MSPSGVTRINVLAPPPVIMYRFGFNWRIFSTVCPGRGPPPPGPPPPSSDEPPSTVRPLARVTDRALQRFEASFAVAPSMLTSSPSVSVLRLQPWRIKTLGGPNSHAHSVTLPLSSFTFR